MVDRSIRHSIGLLDAGHPVRIPVSRTKVLCLTAVGIVAGIGLAALLAFFVQHALDTGEWVTVLLHPVTWACVIGVVGCLVLLPLATVLRLSRSDVLVVTREGLTEVWGPNGAHRAAIPWNDITQVTTARIGGIGFHPGRRVVTYTVTPQTRERIERECTAAGQRPPWVHRTQPGVVLLRGQYAQGPKRLAELLSTAHQRYARQVWRGY